MPKAYKPTAPYKKKLDTPRLQQKEYFQTKLEWCSVNREVVDGVGDVSMTGNGATGVTIYTVPQGKTLFVTNAHIHTQVHVVGVSQYICVLEILSPQTRLLYENVHADVVCSNSNNSNFNMPLRVASGSQIRLTLLGVGAGSSEIIFSGGFIGYLEPYFK